MPTICRPLFSNRLMICPTSPRCTASGLRMISVRSMAGVYMRNDGRGKAGGSRGTHRLARASRIIGCVAKFRPAHNDENDHRNKQVTHDALDLAKDDHEDVFATKRRAI